MERLSSVSTVPLQFYMPSCIIFQYFSNLLGSFFSLPIILLHASRLFPHRLRERCKRGNTGNKPKQRNKKKAKKESSGESGQKKVDEKEEEAATLTNSASSTQASTSPNPPIDNKKKKGRGSR